MTANHKVPKESPTFWVRHRLGKHADRGGMMDEDDQVPFAILKHSNRYGCHDGLKFRIHCDAGERGRLHVDTETLVVNVGQPIRREGLTEIWDAVVVHCAREKDGSFAVTVLICDPDLDEPKEIAVVRSSPEAQEALTVELSP